jgi:Fe-S-cluster-containing hydrogenase component 2
MAKKTASETPFYDETSIAWEAEGLFSRDVNGQLVRFEKARQSDYAKDITLTIDGEAVTVKNATPLTDSQGNIVNDADGRTIPRFTTIYDAATKRYVKQLGDTNPIPILCHQDHMRPVGVCRVCSVEVYRRDRSGREARGQKLVPACHHPVEDGMIIHTLRSTDEAAAKRVRDSVRLLTELLTADHLHTGPDKVPANCSSKAPNELASLVERLHSAKIPFDPGRFASRAPRDRGHDFETSHLINIDHNSCILCERCIRACDEVKQNLVIGRSGKGYTAHIAFDLNAPMGNSSCVSCGECMISCPTDALTFKPDRVVMSDWCKEMIDNHNCRPADANQLRELHPLFRAVPYKFLQWNSSAAVIRPVKAGETLCVQGDHGSTAYILVGDIKFAIIDQSRRNSSATVSSTGIFGGILGRFFDRSNAAAAQKDAASDVFFRRTSAKDRQEYLQTIAAQADGENINQQLHSLGELVTVRGKEELILGEMSCLTYQRRTATIVALTNGMVLEIRRNVLYMLQRNPTTRDMLDKAYRERALQVALRSLKAFSAPASGTPTQTAHDIERHLYELLKDRISLVRVDPGQVIFRQGETVSDFFVVRIGYVKVMQKYFGQDRVLDYLGPGRHFGEVGLLATMDDLQAELGDDRLPAEIWGKRTATCTALDHVELVRIPGDAFSLILRTFPHLREHYVKFIRELFAKNKQQRVETDTQLGNFLDQGLFNAQKLLVLDLERCTRCDECTKACADSHQGVPRLKREGLRLGRFLVASACRSCEDPYCLVGCPVDAIHRGERSEIKIENHCIGCGLCANNCPYGNINMVTTDKQNWMDVTIAHTTAQRVATTCDLCATVENVKPGQPVSCVYACPHEAAFRMSGGELFQLTRITTNQSG